MIIILSNELLKKLFHPGETFLRTKFQDHRYFSIRMSVLASCGCAVLWLWDYVIDPVGAKSTVFLRLAMFVIGFIYTMTLKRVSYGILIPVSMFVTTISWEIIFLNIINRLDTGTLYGISGFMFFLYLPLLMMQGLSFRLNALYIIIIAALPHIMASAGFVQNFQHKQYAVLIWLEVIMAIAVQIAVTSSYIIRYNAKLALKRIAITDEATGLSNRGHFIFCLEREIKQAQNIIKPVTVILMDIDNFKSINDQYGHPAGDEVIKRFADVCKVNIRDNDWVGRLGGEEFGIMLPGVNIEQAITIAERVRQEVEATVITTPKGVIKFTCSAGIAELQNIESFNRLYERVDKALYQAKNQGRNCICLAE